MPAIQSLLIPDPQPLVERFGRHFFRDLPETPGVYLMRDESRQVLYVGKAKNLRKRLGSYRVANPDRMPRRQLRMLHLVRRIDFTEFKTEGLALAHESELLLTLKPRFNRAGIWQGQPRYLAWRVAGGMLDLAIAQVPEKGWHPYGPCGARAYSLRMALLRLMWIVTHTETALESMPHGWFRRVTPDRIASRTISIESMSGLEIETLLKSLFGSDPDSFFKWLRSRVSEPAHRFLASVIEKDVETIDEVISRKKK